MSLIPWKSKSREDELATFSPVTRIRSEMDRMFDRLLRDPWGGWWDDAAMTSPGGWMPALDVTDNEKDIVVRAELPGIDAKDLEITITGDVLTLSGEKKETVEKKGENFHHAERRFGSFRRRVQLPAAVDAEQVTANHKNGVVTIQLKKTAAATRKRIEVKST